jgi:hypothetical protein
MTIGQTLEEIAPTTKALTVVVTLCTATFLAGVTAVLSWGEYRELPRQVAVLEERSVAADASIAELRESIDEAATERARILCLVRLTATGEVLSPLAVTERCP